MEARIHVLTLAVSDLERALSFYRDGLGFDSAASSAPSSSATTTTQPARS
jgi:catechol 2,3-dioxygenase-like lactoylglutathione lyase family enzyme